ncbi:hypothetical protein RQP46_007022 [Phenoliferia psychrophenolica]
MNSPVSPVVPKDPDWAPSSHLAELRHLSAQGGWSASFLQQAKQSVPLSLLRFVLKTLQSYLTLIFLSPATLVTDPLSTGAMFVIYPVIITGLYLATIVFWIMAHIGGPKISQWIGRNWANGLSAPNWADPTIFGSSSAAVIESASALLGGVAAALGGQTKKADKLLVQVWLFDLNVPPFEILTNVAWCQSEARIRNQAEKVWDIRFEGISDLASTGGPYASIFYSKEGSAKPWIALVFKGTSVDNYAEFLVDASITRTSGAAFFGAGTVHEGFYSDLFPQNNGGADGCRIRSHIRVVAARLRSESPVNEGRIPLWVTGHSLGSALAALIYARFMHEPDDLGPNIILRDSYVYGTPRLGDGEFASKFEEAVVSPLLLFQR